jgi:hypothetical protein
MGHATLSISRDGSFVMTDVPDAVVNPDSYDSDQIFDMKYGLATSPINLTGTWELRTGPDSRDSAGDPIVILFYTNPHDSQSSGATLIVAGRGRSMTLCVLVGDPDNGNSYVFRDHADPTAIP